MHPGGERLVSGVLNPLDQSEGADGEGRYYVPNRVKDREVLRRERVRVMSSPGMSLYRRRRPHSGPTRLVQGPENDMVVVNLAGFGAMTHAQRRYVRRHQDVVDRLRVPPPPPPRPYPVFTGTDLAGFGSTDTDNLRRYARDSFRVAAAFGDPRGYPSGLGASKAVRKLQAKQERQSARALAATAKTEAKQKRQSGKAHDSAVRASTLPASRAVRKDQARIARASDRAQAALATGTPRGHATRSTVTAAVLSARKARVKDWRTWARDAENAAERLALDPTVVVPTKPGTRVPKRLKDRVGRTERGIQTILDIQRPAAEDPDNPPADQPDPLPDPVPLDPPGSDGVVTPLPTGGGGGGGSSAFEDVDRQGENWGLDEFGNVVPESQAVDEAGNPVAAAPTSTGKMLAFAGVGLLALVLFRKKGSARSLVR